MTSSPITSSSAKHAQTTDGTLLLATTQAPIQCFLSKTVLYTHVLSLTALVLYHSSRFYGFTHY